MANSLFGIAIDTWGFGILYITAILSFVGCMLRIYLYAKADYAMIASANVVVLEAQADIASEDNQLQSSDDPNGLVHRSIDDSEQGNKEKNFSDEDYNTQTTSTKHDINPNNDSTPKQFTISSLLKTLSTQPNPLLTLSYITAIFTLYIGMSVVENLIFLYFEFLGGSNTLCDLTMAVTVLFELPLCLQGIEVDGVAHLDVSVGVCGVCGEGDWLFDCSGELCDVGVGFGAFAWSDDWVCFDRECGFY